MITSRDDAPGPLGCNRPVMFENVVLLVDGQELGVQTRESSFQLSQDRRNLLELASSSELLKLKGCIDGGLCAEVRDGAF